MSCIWFEGDFSIHCNLESLDDIQCDRSLFEKSRQIVECTKIKMLLQMGLGPNMLEWTTKKKKQQRSRDCKEVKTFMIHEKKFCGFAKQLLLHANERLRVGRRYILHSMYYSKSP